MKTKNNLITYNKKKYYVRRPFLTFKDLIQNSKFSNKLSYDINISGRIGGVARARQLKYAKGIIKMNSIVNSVQTKQFPVQTKWGKLGISLCLP